MSNESKKIGMNPKRGGECERVSEIGIIGFEGRRRGSDEEESVEERGREVSLRIGEREEVSLLTNVVMRVSDDERSPYSHLIN